MASIIMTISGAVLNAAAFTGGNYLAKYLAGDSGEAALEEKVKWPQLLEVDPGHEFMGAVTKEMENHKTAIRRGPLEIYRDQAIVERFNLTLAVCLFGHSGPLRG